jgi:predicted aminopeptidase
MPPGLRAGYAQHHEWDETESYAAWFAQDLNNAHLAGIGIYHQHLPAFEALLRAAGGDLAGFYRAAGDLGRLPRAERDARLAQLAAQSQGEKKEGRRTGATFFTGRSDIRSDGN